MSLFQSRTAAYKLSCKIYSHFLVLWVTHLFTPVKAFYEQGPHESLGFSRGSYNPEDNRLVCTSPLELWVMCPCWDTEHGLWCAQRRQRKWNSCQAAQQPVVSINLARKRKEKKRAGENNRYIESSEHI